MNTITFKMGKGEAERLVLFLEHYWQIISMADYDEVSKYRLEHMITYIKRKINNSQDNSKANRKKLPKT